MAHYRVGIIGFGLAGRDMHSKALIEGLGDMVEIAAVWTRRPVDKKAAAPGFGETAFYTDIDRFFAHPGLDAVHVTTPSGLHRDFVVRAAEAGKHVVCDKPLEVTVEAMEDAIEACEKAGVALSVNFQQRFNPHVQKLKEAVDCGLLGDIVGGVMEAKLYRDPAYYSGSSWHGTMALDGGAALMNQGIHYIDLLKWMMKSPPAEVKKGIAQRLVHTAIEGEDFGYGELTLTNGASMTILGGTCFRPGIDQRFSIRGTDGFAEIVDGVVTEACWRGKDRRDYFGSASKVSFSGGSPVMGLDNHIRYFRAFYTALKNGGDIPITGEEARVATDIVLGIYRAQETGQPVAFPVPRDYRPRF